jgi:hypothetical protein
VDCAHFTCKLRLPKLARPRSKQDLQLPDSLYLALRDRYDAGIDNTEVDKQKQKLKREFELSGSMVANLLPLTRLCVCAVYSALVSMFLQHTCQGCAPNKFTGKREKGMQSYLEVLLLRLCPKDVQRANNFRTDGANKTRKLLSSNASDVPILTSACLSTTRSRVCMCCSCYARLYVSH